MQINDIQVGPAMNDVVYQATKGINRFNKPQDKVRTLFAMYPAELQGASLEKEGLTTPKALIGKRVSIGNPGTGTSVMTTAVFEALGINLKDMKIQNLNWNEGAQAIRNNSLDVQFGTIAAPAPFIMDLSATHKVALVNFSDEELAKIQAKYEYYAPLTIKAGTYPDIKVDVKGRLLTIGGERRVDEEVKEENSYRRECRYGKVERTFSLPFEIDTENVVATHENGILHLEIARPAARFLIDFETCISQSSSS